MHSDVLGLAQPPDVRERKLDRVVDEAAHLELELLEATPGQLLPILAVRQLAVRPEPRRDVPLGVMLAGREAVQRGQQQGI